MIQALRPGSGPSQPPEDSEEVGCATHHAMTKMMMGFESKMPQGRGKSYMVSWGRCCSAIYAPWLQIEGAGYGTYVSADLFRRVVFKLHGHTKGIRCRSCRKESTCGHRTQFSFQSIRRVIPHPPARTYRFCLQTVCPRQEHHEMNSNVAYISSTSTFSASIL